MVDKKTAEPIPGRKRDINVVAEDRNWRSYVDNELMCQDRWNQDWGFLAGGGKGETGKKMAVTKQEKIASLEQQIAALNAKTLTTTNGTYGTKDFRSLELFDNTAHNIVKAEDLMPCPRRPKKS